jgi:hypothetical protein
MDGGRGIVGMLVGAAILAVLGITFVIRSKPAPVPPAPPVVPAPLAKVEPAKPATGHEGHDHDEKAPVKPIEIPGAAPPRAEQQPPSDPEVGKKEEPRYVVPPVEEPEMTLNDKVDQRADFVAALPNGGGYLFERKDARGKKVSGVVVGGTILVTRGIVELLGCSTGGKEHETVLRLECDLQSLDLALTSAGFKRGRLPQKTDLLEAGQGSRILVFIQWNDSDGKLKTYRSEDLIVSRMRNAPMPRVGWTYVAQWAEVEDPTAPKGQKKDRVLIAANSRSGVATFRDSGALLDNPLEEAVDDTQFMANYMVLPRGGTPVRVIFRAASEAELQEIQSLEKVIAKELKEFKPDDREKK